MKIATMTTLCYSARDKEEKTSALEAVRLSVPEGLAQCLAFGFTWWLPLRKG